MHFTKDLRAQGTATLYYEMQRRKIMLKEHLSETFKQLNKNKDEISFEEILQEAEAFVEAEHNAITLTGDIIPKIEITLYIWVFV